MPARSPFFPKDSCKGGLKSESAGKFSTAMINIPFYYPELSHPLHDIDKMSSVTKFTFITCLIHLQVQEVGIRNTANNVIS